MRTFLRHFIFVTFLVSLTCPSFSLTLPEALDMARKHPVLKLHDLKIQGLQYEAIDSSARGPANLAITSENFGGKTGFSELETTLEISLPLADSRRVNARKKLAESNIRLGKLEKETARWLILSQTRRAFNRALAIKALTDKAKENIDNSEKLLNASRIMVESGAVAEQEIYQAELVVKQAKFDLQSLSGTLEEAKAELVTSMGLESMTEIELTGSITAELELEPFDEIEKFIINSHPEVATLQAETGRTQAQLNLIRSENRPIWSITAGARNLGETGNNDFLIGFSVEIPHSRDNKGERAALKTDLDRLALEKQNSQRELRLKLKSAIQKFKRLQQQAIELRDEILPGAYQLFELSLTGYQLGKTDQLVVLQAQKEFLSQKESYLQRLDELYEAADSIESLAGRTDLNDSFAVTN